MEKLTRNRHEGTGGDERKLSVLPGKLHSLCFVKIQLSLQICIF